MNRILVLCLLTFLPSLLFSKVNVVVSILPQKTFVKKIAGDLADVTVMVSPGASPATYEPKPSQMKKITKAQIYFSIGVPFEKAWLPRFKDQNQNIKIIDTAEGIKKLPMQEHHHEANNHSSSTLDPHIWLSPSLVKIQAKNIADALKKIDPNHKTVYENNLKKFEQEIDELNRRLLKILKPCKGKAMMVFHPSWGYFAKDYGLEQIPIEVEGKEPKSKELVNIIHEAKEEGVKILFVQPQFSKRTAKVIATSIGAKIVEADPVALNWAENLIQIAKNICKANR
ncbi:zinc ABC transporter substrate-binding protein [Hydrogenimonas thermophila]|uniref:metal ABC transporter solute-binding protein, Zn/Mn family n=1 Tax=Hydrogenimonas thermophila TaxID=223786 RepID=UPI0029371950|nr:zinc ABC transporter substrate-binding protein [Hydrogenimonas thermophila]WOE70000.1 zinc ABC transporter substrate-binding protein [Hydrogenimonas thermophila]WOE72517.1 zinc ABC transporter substrate-binding protein [Hydrogenimonas thermophila]